MPTLEQDAYRARSAFNSLYYGSEPTLGEERWYRPLTQLAETDEPQGADETWPNQLRNWRVKPGRALTIVSGPPLIGAMRAVPFNADKDRLHFKGSSQPIPPSIQQAIDSSRSILALQEDWDEQGAPGYSESTWQRAIDFLKRETHFAMDTLGRDLPVPNILPGPKGSIDLHWKAPRFELLVNIPPDNSEPATFYGDDYGAHTFKGSFDPATPPHSLALWLLVQG